MDHPIAYSIGSAKLPVIEVLMKEAEREYGDRKKT
jgi:hypothetical protein